jgi:hypothetical protein
MSVSKLATLALTALTLGGCTIFGGPADKALRRTPSFREGYTDGCAAANNPSANPREQQDNLGGTDRVYRRGWATGYQTCRATAVAPGDVPNGSNIGGPPTH